MKRALPRMAIAFGTCFLLCLNTIQAKTPVLSPVSEFTVAQFAWNIQDNHLSGYLKSDTANFQLTDSVVVDAAYKILLFSDNALLRFHFSVINANGSVTKSADITSDFSISTGFISLFDARRIALVWIDKQKAGESTPGITKADLDSNSIPQQ
jgi:hypothetical protein